jgi:hypothetical protein
MNFGDALIHLKNGEGMRLPFWSKEVAIKLQRPDANSKMTHPYLYAQSRFGAVPWVVTQVELLAENWECVQ